jgi:hypothetical protein
MTEFFKGDIVRVQMPRGYTGRGLLSISLMFTTHPEARFEGAIGTVTEINPIGPYTVHQYLVDFRTHDNSKIGIPWQAQWFREEWLELVEQASKVAVAAGSTPESTWPERPAASTEPPLTIAHPDAKIFKEGLQDFAPGSSEGEPAPGIAHPGAKIFKDGLQDFAPGSSAGEGSLGYTGPERADDRSGADVPTYEPTPSTMHGVVDSTTPTNAPAAEVEVELDPDGEEREPTEDLGAGKPQP